MDLQEKLDFEATFLDGDNVEDCGGAMILASEVWEWHQNQIKQREATVRAEERAKSHKCDQCGSTAINHTTMDCQLNIFYKKERSK